MFGSVNFVDGRDLHWVPFNDEYIGGNNKDSFQSADCLDNQRVDI